MKDKPFWSMVIGLLLSLILFAGVWLYQNEQLHKAVLNGNEQQANTEVILLRNQAAIKKILDDRTPLIEKIKDIEKNEKTILSNQHVIHELRQRIEELEKNQNRSK